MEEETKVCTDPKCKHNGAPQPLSAFGIHPRWKKPMKICTECFKRRRSEGQQERNANRGGASEKPAGADVQSPKKTKKSIPVVNFAIHPELLERIEKTASLEYRSPEQQLLWMVKTYVSPMEEGKYF
jgi:hypothetical protein